ncbi:MAG TPA: DUF3422 domain-containing protein [Pseudomonadales bacterium]|nr:DUF3422 domain-containing protein [Pseudomonadales bacterium]
MRASSDALPQDHPLRRELNNEVHARPPDAMVAPTRLSYLVLRSEPGGRDRERAALEDLVRRFDGPALPQAGNHFSADLGPFRVTWEQHTEFVRYTFLVDDAADGEDPPGFGAPVITRVPSEWLGALSERLMVASHVLLLPATPQSVDPGAVADTHFNGNELVGAVIEGGYETALTDFRIHGDRFSRLVVFDHAGGARQTGRSVQRLLELDSYRIMALLALPVARALVPRIEAAERELAELADALSRATPEDEAALLERLSRLEADLSLEDSTSHARFSAAAAYYAVVRSRVRDLREERIEGLQTFQEFTERRLAPAMNTCVAVSERLNDAIARTARMIQTLATRVEMTREQQTQAVLRSMNRRVELQLRLQGTVEGLSVAAISYYVVGLVGYAVKGLKSAGVPLNEDLVIGISIPVVVLAIAWAIRRVRHAVTDGDD